MNRNVERAVRYIQDLARAGQTAPTNQQLAEHLGFTEARAGTDVVRRAEVAGLIKVERGQVRRVIAAADGSWRTSGDAGAPHWRDRITTRPAS